MARWIDLVKNFDSLSDDVLVPEKVTDAIRNVSEWSRRRNPPPIRRIQVAPNRFHNRVGDIRAYVRGELPSA